MGLAVYPGSIKRQADGMNAILTGDNENLAEIVTSISQFTSDNSLQGNAWNNMKEQLRNHKMVIQGIICANDSMMQDNDSLKSLVGDEDLIEDELTESINQLKASNNCYQICIDNCRNIMKNDVINALLGWHYQSAIQNYQNCMNQNNSTIMELEEKIKKLQEIENSTGSLYAEAKSLYIAVGSGISEIQKAWNPDTGQFNVPANSLWKFTLMPAIKAKTQSDLAKYMKEKLGEDALTYDEFSKLPEMDKKKYLEKVAKLVFEYLPNIDYELGSQKIEIPIGIDMSLYYEVSGNIETNPDNAITISQAMEEHKLTLQSLSAAIGNAEISKGVDGSISYQIESEIGDYMTISNSVKTNFQTNTISAEAKVETSIENGSIASAIGINKSFNNNGWEAIPVEEPVPVTVPVNKEKEWWEKGWDVITDIGDAIGDTAASIGNWVSEHPAETGAIISGVIVIGCIIAAPATGGQSLWGLTFAL